MDPAVEILGYAGVADGSLEVCCDLIGGYI